MLHLLFLLFICFGVYSPSYQPIIYDDVVDVPSLTTKQAYNYNGSTFVGLSEIVSFDYYSRFIENLQNYEFVYNSGTKVTDFLNGTSVNLYTSNIWYVELTDSGAIRASYTIDTFNLQIVNVEPTLQKFLFTFHCTGASYSVRLEGWYFFTDGTHQEFLFNNFMYKTTEVNPLNWEHSCISFAIGDYISLFPSGTSGGGNYNVGYENGYSVGANDGYQRGYTEAMDIYSHMDTTASTIFNGIFEVGLLPVNVFLTIFNFEVFGINISGLVSALLTVSVVIIILRFLLGGKSDDK